MVVILIVVLALVQVAQLVRITLAVQGEILPADPAQVSNALAVIVPIVLTVTAVIFVQIAKLAIHSAIQIISDYFYALLYYFLQLMLTHINYLLIV